MILSVSRRTDIPAYSYYFQYTVTGYGKDMEPNVPDKKKMVLPSFMELSDRIGAERVIWRYDPIIFTKKYTQEYHLKAFSALYFTLDAWYNAIVRTGKLQ